MLKKTIRRLGALAMVLAMAVSVFAVSASAEGATGLAENDKLTLNKTVTADGKTYAPNTTFNFTIEKGAASNGETGKYNGNVVYEGVTGGVSLSESSITFSPANGIIDADTGLTKNITINTNATAFPHPGVYHYIVKEVAPQTGYEGITYDTTERDLYVYVVTKDGARKVSHVLMVKSGEEAKNGAIVNDYGKTKDTTHDVTITKKLEGDAAYDLESGFNINVKVTSTVSGEQYLMVVNGDTANPITLVSGTAQTITLHANQSAKIYGLTASDKVEVSEASYASEGFQTPRYDNNANATKTTTTDGDVYYCVTKDGATIDVVNIKNNTSPTGVIMTIAPYALMVVLAGAFAVVFLTRRNRAE